MKSHLLVLPLILVTSAAVADAQRSALSARVDAQAQAAALLGSTHTSVTSKGDAQRRFTSPGSAAMDAQASAAALLGGHQTPRIDSASIAIEQPSGAWALSDAQTQAAALLRGSRRHEDPPLRAQTGAARAR